MLERASDPQAVRQRLEDFLALEHAGWKGERGTSFLSSPGRVWRSSICCWSSSIVPVTLQPSTWRRTSPPPDHMSLSRLPGDSLDTPQSITVIKAALMESQGVALTLAR